jgi:AcrR family transcriptional regulator
MQGNGSAASKPTAASTRERERIMAGMLLLSGELGYRRATVRLVIERSAVPPSRFYRHFRTRAECFAAAQLAEAERLCGALLAAARAQASFQDGLRAALEELFRYVAEHPLQARATLREVYAAEGAALSGYEEVLERLSRAFDSARRETLGSRHSPPPGASSFIVGAIEEFVRFRVGRPDCLWAALPELMHLATAPYLGDRAAARELRRPAPSGRR